MPLRNSFVLGAVLASAGCLLCSCSGHGNADVPAKTYQMGERVVLAPLTYAVFEKQWVPQLGVGADARLPQNRFLLVRISATNGGGSQGFVPNLSVEDDAGNSCAELSNGDGVTNWIGYLRPIKPADTLQGNILFDCAPKHYRLKLANEDNKTAYVDIPLSFDGDTVPTVALPAKDDKSNKLAHPK